MSETIIFVHLNWPGTLIFYDNLLHSNVMFTMHALNIVDVTQISRRYAFPGIRVMIRQ